MRPHRTHRFSTPMECAHPGGLLRLTGLPKRGSVPRKNISNAASALGGGNDKPRPDTDASYSRKNAISFLTDGTIGWEQRMPGRRAPGAPERRALRRRPRRLSPWLFSLPEQPKRRRTEPPLADRMDEAESNK